MKWLAIIKNSPHPDFLFFPPERYFMGSFGFLFSTIQLVCSVWSLKTLILIKRTLDLALMDHGFLSQIWLAVDHFYYYRWNCARTNQYYLSWTELCAKSILISRKFKSSGEGLVCIIENNIAIQTGGNSGDSPCDRQSQSHRTCEASKRGSVHLTLHCCACWLCEEWNKQEIDEVDEGQGIVPEQASCKQKHKYNELSYKSTFSQQNCIWISLTQRSLYCFVCDITSHNFNK